jgi:hypothetical protein
VNIHHVDHLFVARDLNVEHPTAAGTAGQTGCAGTVAVQRKDVESLGRSARAASGAAADQSAG